MITGLSTYPIKSCRPVACKRAYLQPIGLSYDRGWVVVQEANARFITQREEPRMCLVDTHLPQAVLEAPWGADPASDAALTVAAPGVKGELRVPLRLPGAGERPLRPVSVWEFDGLGWDEGDEAAAFFTEFLGRPARLVRYAGKAAASAAARPTVRTPNPEFMGQGQEVAFADGFPLLVATEEAMADLNTRISSRRGAGPATAGGSSGGGGQPLSINRFRANVVVAGVGAGAGQQQGQEQGPWADDQWRRIRMAGVPIQFVKPCSRCKVTTIDQETAEGGAEPLATLATFRTGRKLGFVDSKGSSRYDHPAALFFGGNGVPQGAGLVGVGDAVEVLETGPWA